jgi:hypothetical protein
LIERFIVAFSGKVCEPPGPSHRTKRRSHSAGKLPGRPGNTLSNSE